LLTTLTYFFARFEYDDKRLYTEYNFGVESVMPLRCTVTSWDLGPVMLRVEVRGVRGVSN